jgi:cellulose synthase/poly-beta-1,6-N-acetylglucosamine synthase-like glycosyltransferase
MALDGYAVSVLTAVSPSHLRYLDDAYESLRGEGDVAWEWVLQLDGDLRPEAVSGSVRSDARVTVQANAARLGAAATRNRGLTRCAAELVQNLDSDDVLLPGSLHAGIEALRSDASLAFAFGRTADLHADGRVVNKWEHAVPYPPGRIEAGVLDGHFLSEGTDPIPMSSLMWRKVRIYEAGGWSALSSLEDAALVYAVASRWPCYYLDRETQLWRVHPDQMTQSEGFAADRAVNSVFIRARLAVLRADPSAR